jgi:hypothetical protein
VYTQSAASSSARALNCGAIGNVELSDQGVWAVSVAANQILTGDLSARTLMNVIPFRAGKLALAKNGSTLFAEGDGRASQYLPDRSVRLYSLPASHLLSAVSATTDGMPALANFESSHDNSHLAQLWRTSFVNPPIYEWRVFSGSGATALATFNVGTTLSQVDFTATGQRFSLSYDTVSWSSSKLPRTEIYEGATLVGAAEGQAITWLDEDRLLLATYTATNNGTGPLFNKDVIVDKHGAVVGQTGILPPMTNEARPLAGGTRVYSEGSVRDVASGAVLWDLPFSRSSAPTSDANDMHVIAVQDEIVRFYAHP